MLTQRHIFRLPPPYLPLSLFWSFLPNLMEIVNIQFRSESPAQLTFQWFDISVTDFSFFLNTSLEDQITVIFLNIFHCFYSHSYLEFEFQEVNLIRKKTFLSNIMTTHVVISIYCIICFEDLEGWSNKKVSEYQKRPTICFFNLSWFDKIVIQNFYYEL